MYSLRSLIYSEVSFLCSLSISRIDFVRFRILMSTVSSFFRPPTGSTAQEPHFVERAVCKFTQRINERLFRWLERRNILEQSLARFVPIDYELVGGVLYN